MTGSSLPVCATHFDASPSHVNQPFLLLIEDEERLVTELGELRAPAGAAANGLIRLDRADDVDLLAVVDLIPDALQDLAERRRIRVAAIHEPRHIREAHFARRKLLVIEHAQAARARRLVAIEREIDFLDAEALGAGAEGFLGADGAAAEQDDVFALQHRRITPSRRPSSGASRRRGIGLGIRPVSAASASGRRRLPDPRAS